MSEQHEQRRRRARWRLRPDDSTPLHTQLEQLIRTEIARGRWTAGERIPSERELMRLAGISRATVRQTIGSLERAGILERVHGRGTFVARPRFEQGMQRVYSFSEQIQALGLKLEDELLRGAIQPAPPEIAAALDMAAGQPMISLRRLRRLEGVPLMISVSFMPQALCPDLLDVLSGMSAAQRSPSLYRLLVERYDLPVLRATDTLEAIAADGLLAGELQISRGAPLMCVRRLAFTRGDRPLHIGHNYVRGEMCRFRVELTAQLELTR